MRITDEVKRTMLEEVLFMHRSSKEVAEEYHTDFRNFKKQVARAREHGIDSVLHINCRKTYSKEFKLEVVEFIRDGATYGQAATKYGLPWCVARSWYLKYSDGGPEALFRDNRGRKKMSSGTPKKAKSASSDELEELRKRNRELEKQLKHAEMENEFLKKLDALVRERLERENKR